MEKEIGSIPDRSGFDVHVDGEEITITQYNGDFDCDVVTIHGCDALALIDLLDLAVNEIIAGGQTVNACDSDGAHCPDGSCCTPCRGPVDRSGEMR